MKSTFAVLTCLSLLVAVPAYAKSNFTGEWKLNVSKSDFGPMPAPTSMTQTITHEDPKLKVHRKQSGDQGEREDEPDYLTDGTETTNEIRGNPLRSVAKWDGDTLVIETKGSFNGNEFSVTDRWSLSEDGKALTIKRHFSSSMGEGDTTVFLDKQ